MEYTLTYNLLTEHWIPVLYHNGSWKRIGILEVLKDSGNIRQIAASNPMDNIAILRFLLALLYWCKGNPPEDKRGINCSGFIKDWITKLEENRDCFNLLGDGRRFYQDAGASRKKTVTELLQEVPTGNNFWHFRHSTDEVDAFCPACCTLGLLRLPLYSTSGLPNLKSGINGTPPIYVFRKGGSLKEILLLNWIFNDNLGVPLWTNPNITSSPDNEAPLLNGLTIPARRVWLHNPSEEHSLCNSCGNKDTVTIKTCEFETAGKLENDLWTDPHVIYTTDMKRKTIKSPNLTSSGNFKTDRPLYKLLSTIIDSGVLINRDIIQTLSVVGFTTDNAKNVDVWEQTIKVPSFESIAEHTVQIIELWQKESWRLGAITGKDKAAGSSLVAFIRPHVENSISSIVYELLSGGEDAWKKAAEEYSPMMKMVAKSLSPGFTTSAVKRRGWIENIKPDIHLKEKSLSINDSKKGGTE